MLLHKLKKKELFKIYVKPKTYNSGPSQMHGKYIVGNLIHMSCLCLGLLFWEDDQRQKTTQVSSKHVFSTC